MHKHTRTHRERMQGFAVYLGPDEVIPNHTLTPYLMFPEAVMGLSSPEPLTLGQTGENFSFILCL